MRTQIVFSKTAFSEYSDWAEEDLDTFVRIRELIEAIRREPFKGIGKPEPLRHEFKGCWSRRITQKHRLVYQVTYESVVILTCRGHYDDKYVTESPPSA